MIEHAARSSNAVYVLPLRWDHADSGELTQYVRRLSDWIDVLVVDGSPPDVFAEHGAAWKGLVTHLAPRAPRADENGKAVAVMAGLRASRAVRRHRRRRRALRPGRARAPARPAAGRRHRPAAELLRAAQVACAVGHRPHAPQPRRGRRLSGHPGPAAPGPPPRVRHACPLREPRAAADGPSRRRTRDARPRPVRGASHTHRAPIPLPTGAPGL